MTEQREPAEARLGEVLREDGRVGLRYERRLANPPDKVWRAITESEHLRHWFPADIVGERRAGARLELRFWPESVDAAGEEMEQMGIDPGDAVLPGEVLTWDPPRVFELSWDTDRLRWELERAGDGTRLVLTTWLLGEQGPKGVPGTAAGYHVCLDALQVLLDGGPAAHPVSAETEQLQQQYAARAAAT